MKALHWFVIYVVCQFREYHANLAENPGESKDFLYLNVFLHKARAAATVSSMSAYAYCAETASE